MKKSITTILRKGVTTSTKSIADFVGYLYPLEHVLCVNESGFVACNDNAFWAFENMQNRRDFYHDICRIEKRSVQDNAYFRILNRFENGDKYGIEVE